MKEEMWRGQDGDLTAVALYDAEAHKFTVRVTRGERELSEDFVPEYVPRFGIDVSDMAEIETIAERLAEQIEKQ